MKALSAIHFVHLAEIKMQQLFRCKQKWKNKETDLQFFDTEGDPHVVVSVYNVKKAKRISLNEPQFSDNFNHDSTIVTFRLLYPSSLLVLPGKKFNMATVGILNLFRCLLWTTQDVLSPTWS